jgi:hypothetical protein
MSISLRQKGEVLILSNTRGVTYRRLDRKAQLKQHMHRDFNLIVID